jgi:hypothetical protein
MQNSRDEQSRRNGGIRALWLVGSGCLMGLVLAQGVWFNRIDFGIAALLFFGAPLAEVAALIVALWAGRGSAQARFAVPLALVCLCIWGWFFYKLVSTPLIKLF